VAVKSSGEISAEPARGQKIEERVVTDLDLRNDENTPDLTSSAVAEEHQDVSSTNAIDQMADVITGGLVADVINHCEELMQNWPIRSISEKNIGNCLCLQRLVSVVKFIAKLGLAFRNDENAQKVFPKNLQNFFQANKKKRRHDASSDWFCNSVSSRLSLSNTMLHRKVLLQLS